MQEIAEAIDNFFSNYIGFTIPNVHVVDIVEVLIIAYFIYQILRWFQHSRAWSLLRGLLVVVGFFIIAAIFQMNTILWLGQNLLNVALIMIIVVFQPELRKALESLGRRDFLHIFSSLGITRNIVKRFEDKTLNDLVTASYEMGAVKTGALIVIEQDDLLDEYVRTGITLDSIVSRQLIINIFEKNTPLHDGAVIVRGDRIVAATCYLPLSDNMNLSKDLGTRHRAAIGMSEVCDAFIIVVSEETGYVSIARDGRIRRNVTDEELRAALLEMQAPQEEEKKDKKEKKSHSTRRAKHETESEN